MSRRDSRASLNARQNDALTEFENCKSHHAFSSVGVDLVAVKKKFLLANKHITKYARIFVPKSGAEPFTWMLDSILP